MNKRKKMTIVAAGTFLSLTMMLTGCAKDTDNGNSVTLASDNGGAVTSDNGGNESGNTGIGKDAAGVSQAINKYYSILISESPTALENSSKIESVVREVSGDKTYEAFSTTSDPFTAFDELDDKQAKELADKIQQLNPVANVFDYSQMSDKDRAVLNLLNIASSSMLNEASDQDISITAPEDAIIIDGNSANVAYGDMLITVNGEEQAMSDVFGTDRIYLTYIDDTWKVDGQKTYESVQQSAANSSASDDGEG